MIPARPHPEHSTQPDQVIARDLLHRALRKLDLHTEGGEYAPVVWSSPMRELKAFGLRAVAELTLAGVLQVRDLETDDILARSKPFAFNELDTDAPMVEEAMKAWGAARERQRRGPIVTMEGGAE
jgi:hypothetical protein